MTKTGRHRPTHTRGIVPFPTLPPGPDPTSPPSTVLNLPSDPLVVAMRSPSHSSSLWHSGLLRACDQTQEGGPSSPGLSDARVTTLSPRRAQPWGRVQRGLGDAGKHDQWLGWVGIRRWRRCRGQAETEPMAWGGPHNLTECAARLTRTGLDIPGERRARGRHGHAVPKQQGGPGKRGATPH